MINSPASLPLGGHVIAITGGGDGIGRATAYLCADRGASVAVIDHNIDGAQTVADGLIAHGGAAIAIHADVRSESDIDSAMRRVGNELGTLTGIVNNAGTIVTQSLTDTTVKQWDRVMNVNAKGVFLGCRAAVREFLDSRTPGSIVNTGSISATVGLPQQAAYCASKGAVLQLSRQVAVDYARFGIRCNVVSPGSVRTAVLDDYLAGQPNPDNAAAAITAQHPLARLATPEEIAEVICFALSPAASFVTGANLAADGGYTAQCNGAMLRLTRTRRTGHRGDHTNAPRRSSRSHEVAAIRADVIAVSAQLNGRYARNFNGRYARNSPPKR